MTTCIRTGNGLVLEGPLTIYGEDEGALILVGEEFLDDWLRQRFDHSAAADPGSTPGGLATEDMKSTQAITPLLLSRVRITIEQIDE